MPSLSENLQESMVNKAEETNFTWESEWEIVSNRSCQFCNIKTVWVRSFRYTDSSVIRKQYWCSHCTKGWIEEKEKV